MTIRNLDDALKQALRIQAARNRVSMEEEARRLLENGVRRQAASDAPVSAWDVLERLKAANGGGVDWDVPSRSDWHFRPVDLGE